MIRVFPLLLAAVANAQPAEFTVTVPAGDVAVVVIEQYPADISVALATDPTVRWDTLGARHLPEIIALGPYENEQRVTLAVHSKGALEAWQQAAAAAPRQWRFPADSETGDCALLLGEAGRWSPYRAETTAGVVRELLDCPGLDAFREHLSLLLPVALRARGDSRQARLLLEDQITGEISWWQFRLRYQLAMALMDLDRDEQAYAVLAELDRWIPAVRENEAHRRRERVGIRLPMLVTLQRSGQVAQARAVRARLQADLQEIEEPHVHAVFHQTEAVFAMLAGDLDTALVAMGQASPYLHQVGDFADIAHFHRNQAYLHERAGEYRQAMLALLQAERHLDAESDAMIRTDVHSDLAALLEKLGDRRRARYYTRLAIEGENHLGRWLRWASLQLALGRLERAGGHHALALQAHWMALLQFQALGDAAGVARAHVDLSEDYLASGDAAAAHDHITRASAAARAAGRRPDSIMLAAQLRASAAVGDVETLRRLLAGLAASDPQTHTAEVIHLYDAAVEVSAALGDLDGAIRFGRRLVEVVTRLRDEMYSDRLGSHWSARTDRALTRHVHNLVDAARATGEEGLAAEAFAVNAAARAASLRKQRWQSVVQEDSLPAAQRAALRAARAAVARAAAMLDAAIDAGDGTAREARAAYFEALEELRAVRAATGVDVMGTTELPDFSLAKVQAGLAPGELLLSFAIAPQRGVAFRVTADGWTVLETVDGDELREALAGLRRPAAWRKEKMLVPLIEGVALERFDHFLIEAHGWMAAVPFAALSIEAQRYTPLNGYGDVTFLPSVNAWLAPSSQRRAGELRMAMLADPVFSARDDRLPPSLLPMTDPLRQWAAGLDRLPGTAEEAAQIRRLFPQGGVEVFLGPSATRDKLFAREVRDAQFLHIASHGYFREQNPEVVGFLLSPQDPQAGVVDLVTLADLASFRFSSRLVVISGCETGLGEELGGEGLNSVARRFLAQGAGSVVSTLWPVADTASARFMKLFYDHLVNEGLEIPRALGAAQRAFRRQREYSDPKYWAPYVLSSVERTAPPASLSGH